MSNFTEIDLSSEIAQAVGSTSRRVDRILSGDKEPMPAHKPHSVGERERANRRVTSGREAKRILRELCAN